MWERACGVSMELLTPSSACLVSAGLLPAPVCSAWPANDGGVRSRPTYLCDVDGLNYVHVRVSVCSFVCEIPVIPVAKMIIPTICPLAPWHSIPVSSSCTHHTHTDTHCSTGAITQELGRLVPREGSPWSATELAHCPWRKKWRYRLAKHTDKRLETKNRGGVGVIGEGMLRGTDARLVWLERRREEKNSKG